MPKPPDFKTCQWCGAADLAFSWQAFVGGTRHLRADCRACRRCLGYAPQTPENIGRLPANSRCSCGAELTVRVDCLVCPVCDPDPARPA